VDALAHGKHDNAAPMIANALRLASPETSDLELPTQLRDFFLAIGTFLNASIQRTLKHPEIGFSLYMESATRFESSGFVTELALAQIGIAHCLLDQHRPEEAVSTATNAAELLSSPDCEQSIANALYEVLALAHLTLGAHEQAREALETAVKYRHLEAVLPKRSSKENEQRSMSSSSTQSLPAPTAPRGQPARVRFGRLQSKPATVPLKELGRLQLSVAKLVNGC
jgi:tetratricopeptide (TPR) repeat protein